jgi:hypothetical protein
MSNVTSITAASRPAEEKRWRAVIQYHDSSTTTKTFDEFSELGDIIERGPDWRFIHNITVHLAARAPLGEDGWHSNAGAGEVPF